MDEPDLATVYGSSGSVARRHGDIVRRPVGPHSRTVLDLLRHLEAVDFAGAPRVAGTGVSSDGYETVTYIPGTTAHPHAWNNGTLTAIGALLWDLHTATASFEPSPSAAWKPSWPRHFPGVRPVIGHCDTGPWNIIRRPDATPALIDWEYAGPVDAMWELAETVWLNAQLHDDDIAERWGLPDARARAGHARLIADGYRLDRAARTDLARRLPEVAVHAARAEAVEHHVHADSTQAVTDDGYPLLWAITWRARSASWMLSNRNLIEHAMA